MNPRYAAYARAHGMAPEAMIEHDRAQWPAGPMCGFLLWMSGQNRAFWAANPSAFLDRYTIRDQAAWTAFLETAADRQQGGAP